MFALCVGQCCVHRAEPRMPSGPGSVELRGRNLSGQLPELLRRVRAMPSVRAAV